MPNVYQFKDFEGSSHRILIHLIRRYAPGGTLLDLGAAGGELGAALRPHFRKTTGFEYDIDRIADLRVRFDRVVIADLERVWHLPWNNQAIVLADVLEHLKDPARILELCRRSLAPDGYIFVSVPNIANITTRLGLLFGVFQYRERGILDATHLRFYTKKTIRDEIERAGFEIVVLRGSSIPIRLIAPRVVPQMVIRAGERTLSGITYLWRALFAYQIIIAARPKA